MINAVITINWRNSLRNFLLYPIFELFGKNIASFANISIQLPLIDVICTRAVSSDFYVGVTVCCMDSTSGRIDRVAAWIGDVQAIADHTTGPVSTKTRRPATLAAGACRKFSGLSSVTES